MGGVSRTFPSVGNIATVRSLRVPLLALIASFLRQDFRLCFFVSFAKYFLLQFYLLFVVIISCLWAVSDVLRNATPAPTPTLVHQVKGLCNGSSRTSFAQNTYHQACVTPSLYRNPIGLQFLSLLARRSSGSWGQRENQVITLLQARSCTVIIPEHSVSVPDWASTVHRDSFLGCANLLGLAHISAS